MNNPRLASRYAKSIIDLAVEQNQLDVVFNDMNLILRICKTNPDFVTILRSPIIKPRSKGKIIAAVLIERVSELTAALIKLLVIKTRELNLPEIAVAFVEQYNILKNVHKVKFTTAFPVSEAMKTFVLSEVRGKIPSGSLELETVVDPSLIGGFILESEGQLIDASILKDLKEIKMQFLNNEYLRRIR